VVAKADDALALLESGYAAPMATRRRLRNGSRKAAQGDGARGNDVCSRWTSTGWTKFSKLFTRHTLDLGLQPVTIEFVRQNLQTLVTTLANMGREMSDTCRRRSAVISAQFTEVSRQYAVDFTARAADPASARKTSTPF